jgi:hypothetical protein
MKRFLAFAGASYYADGGWLDFRGDASTAEEAADIARGAVERAVYVNDLADWWWHVADGETGQVVDGADGSFCGEMKAKPEEGEKG